jgi:hypothetical protein
MALIKDMGISQEAEQEVEKDVIGGGAYGVLSTDIYDLTIKLAYLGQSNASKASFIEVHFETQDGKQIIERQYFTNKDGNNYYTNKDKVDVKLPGYSLLNSLSMLLIEKELNSNRTEEKQIKKYDYDSKTDIIVPAEVLVDWLGKKVRGAITKTIEPKKTQKNGKWVESTDVKEKNEIVKYFHATKGVTLAEAKEGKEATFADKWLDKNKGKVFDKMNKKTVVITEEDYQNKYAFDTSDIKSTSTKTETTKSLFD